MGIKFDDDLSSSLFLRIDADTCRKNLLNTIGNVFFNRAGAF